MASEVWYFTGFLSGSLLEANNASGNVSLTQMGSSFILGLDIGYLGNLAFVYIRPPDDSGTLNGALDEQNATISLYLRVDTLPDTASAEFLRIFNAGTDAMRLRLTTAGLITVHKGDGTLLATSAVALVADTWYRIDARQTHTAGAYQVLLDTVEILAGTGGDWDSPGIPNTSAIYVGDSRTSGLPQCHLSVNGIVMGLEDPIADPFSVQALFPDVVGYYPTDMIPDWKMLARIDEAPPDNETTVIHLTSTGARTAFCEDLAALQGTQAIAGVKTFHLLARGTSGLSATVKAMIRRASTDYAVTNSATVPIPFTTSSLAQFYEKDPSTSVVWTVAGVNGTELGVNVVAGTFTAEEYQPRWTASSLHVLMTGTSGVTAARVLPILYHLSDYPSADTGAADGYDDSARFLLEGLDFGDPDGLKQLLHLYMIYESLREVPIQVKLWKRYPLTDSGTLYELSTYASAAEQAEEPGVFYGKAVPAWGTARYAHRRRFYARVEFSKMISASFTAGFAVAADLTPFELIQLAWHFRRMPGPGRANLAE